MTQTTIRTAGAYTIATDGADVFVNGNKAAVRWSNAPIKGTDGKTLLRAGQAIMALVETGIAGTGGKQDVVSLTANEVAIHTAAVAARNAAEKAEWLASAAGQANLARINAERAFDLANNEGGEGYNPHRTGAERTYARTVRKDRDYPLGA